MTDPPSSASLAQITARGGSLVISCRQSTHHADCPIHHVSGVLAIERWGAETTLVQMEERMRCLTCRGPIKARPDIPMHVGGCTPPEPFVGILSRYGNPYAEAVASWAEWEAQHARS
jgi:hypothetical protein